MLEVHPMLNNRSIKNKLSLFFIGFFVLFAGIIFYSIKQMDTVGAVADNLSNDRIPKVMALFFSINHGKHSYLNFKNRGII
jgi:ATP/ADP translocase